MSTFEDQVIEALKAKVARLRAALEIAVQLEISLSECLTNTYWEPDRGHIERARNDAARMARALANEQEGK